ncbi:RagB/SusD family nutrient uptake outer membrane protein [Pedobacter nutrimenti]|uniref:RagB/SusD family nutrient uptake outer membrane protein n=1 Tax=Pedobacter nutrimenti TaxID=1241337 RepID=UPI002931B61B|nr:RagB/SusD family nutrient uptake outer membrane protein [Pedobacter nutrimenti]
MKRLLYIFILVFGILISNTGCKKFLAEKSQDLIKPSTVQDLTALMAGEAYPYQTNLHLLLNMVTDDITCNGGQGQATYQSTVLSGKAPFTWSKNMYQELLQPGGIASTTYLDSWQILYKRIAGCNVVLAYADQVTGATADKQNLKGQALALRAYYYFILVNLYGKPYNAPGADPATSPGVPLKLTMEVTDELFKRNSVAEVYTQIELDLKNAATILMNYPEDNGVYKMSETAVYTLLSRMYLYEEKWALAVEYANKGLAKKSTLTQLGSFGAINYNNYNVNTVGNNLDRIYDPATSAEVIWAYVPITGNGAEGQFLKSSLIPNYNLTRNPPYAVSPDLLNLYDSKGVDANDTYIGDLRPRLYFNCAAILVGFIPPSTGVFTYKSYAGGMGGSGIRVAELYMNRAEANIQQFMSTGNDALRVSALQDLNTLRMSRYDTRQTYVPVNITDKTQLLNFYRDERRREFPFDGHRWFDLRRYGMPSISHFYQEVAGTGETFTLAQGDSRYTFPIPQEVLDRNGELTQNP